MIQSIALLLLFTPFAFMVKQEDFKLCSQSSFCTRQLAYADKVDLNTLPSLYTLQQPPILKDGILAFTVMNTRDNVTLTGKIEFMSTGALRFALNDMATDRYAGTPLHSLMEYAVDKNVKEIGMGEYEFNGYVLVIEESPFKVRVKSQTEDVFVFNDRNYFNYEHHRSKDTSNDTVDLTDPMRQGEWQEEFKGFKDSKPKGPESIGIDFTLVGFKHTYGLAEHASDITLHTTRYALLIDY